MRARTRVLSLHEGATKAPRISVLADPVDGFTTLVELAGEHDYATREAVRAALAPLRGDTLVCLAGCRFIDASVLTVIAAKAAELERDGAHLALRIDPDAYTVNVLVGLFADIDPDGWLIWDIRRPEVV